MARPRDQPGHLPVPRRAAHRRAAVPRHRHARAVGAGACQRARGTGGQRRRRHDRGGRRIHADAGRLARDPHLQPRAHDRRWPTASSSRRRTIRPTTAASSTTRRTAGRRNATSPRWIEATANELLEHGLHGVKRDPLREGAARAPRRTGTTISAPTSSDLGQRHRHGRHPRRRASAWASIRSAAPACTTGRRIAERYGLNLTVVNDAVDPTFRFMTVDWDGQIRMDPSSPYAMRTLDRAEGSLRHRVRLRHRPRPARHRHPERGPAAAESLSVGRDLLPLPAPAAVAQGRGGRQDRGQQPDDRSRGREARPDALRSAGRLQVVRRRACSTARSASAAKRAPGASFLRRDGTVWTTDKDGIVPALLAAEITARTGRDPGELYRELTREFGDAGVRPHRGAGHAGAEEAAWRALAAAGPAHGAGRRRRSRRILTHAPGNGAPIGGVKVIAKSGWFAARPSGTENIYKIYAESFRGAEHLRRILSEAQAIVDDALGGARPANRRGRSGPWTMARPDFGETRLDALQRDTFGYFLHETNPANGLVPTRRSRALRRASPPSASRWRPIRSASSAAG